MNIKLMSIGFDFISIKWNSLQLIIEIREEGKNQESIHLMGKWQKTQKHKNTTHKRAKRSAFPQQVNSECSIEEEGWISSIFKYHV